MSESVCQIGVTTVCHYYDDYPILGLCARVEADEIKNDACPLIRIPAIVRLTLFTLRVLDNNDQH
jgi:hypothetical protein